ncbi:MAG: type II toxin-antitoxin system VapC family toxin [Deltaproteobacteria bacterium]|nr:type II toxin-antitoxin system VapC family toxin [Deltaproteobacteria bacterium]
MDKKIKAYVDTSAFISALDRSDTYHPLFAQRFAAPPPLITTPLVIAEGQGWFLKRYDTMRALQFMSFIERLSVLTILPADMKMVREATRLLRQFSDQDLSLTDAAGLWTMKRHGITHCWSTDRHLALAGASLAIYE